MENKSIQNKEFLCKLAALFWKYYFLEPSNEHFEEMYNYFSEDLVMIGTGKHEFYTNVNQILDSMNEIQTEAKVLMFEVLDEWYECQEITENVYVVYGGIWARQQDPAEDEPLIDMDTRFSFLFHLDNDQCKLVHIHHSMPYFDQQQGEYYPKTLAEKTKEALNLAEEFKRQSELDLMSDLYNNVSFKHYVSQNMKTCRNANLYLFDLDYFKGINDTYGHILGDSVLKLFANKLKKYFETDAIIGRIGGDEFAIFDYNPQPNDTVIKSLLQMQEEFNQETLKLLVKDSASFSVGIASMICGVNLYENIFNQADKALYHAKKLGRNTYYWHGE